ncbi:SDR family oxidoreductase [Leptospira fluminis]|uniref:SDR family oxidoreductase n=1 Tax=Leptospira fluminis TaxID=2484979 RepID=A0A4V3JEH1_9LEPT|nr:SDR family oxidoreductase [Leptospira fluminis]TGK18164.1 SDR family oxidoreductase [Leptospira fluminis]
MSSYFEGKVFLVTGASSGIGRSLAEELSDRGATVGVIARRKEFLRDLKNSVSHPEKMIVLPADVTSESELKKALEEFRKKVHSVDGFIHNAGVTMRALAAETDLKVFRDIMNTNYYPLVYLYRSLEKDLRQTNGHVVAVSSIQGKFATQYRSGYAASKHAVQAFMDSIRLENSESGIHVLTVSPGFVKTDISIKAFSADGSPHGILDEGQKRGLEPGIVSRQILKAIESRKRDLYPAGFKEKFGLFLSRFSPEILDRILLKSRVT